MQEEETRDPTPDDADHLVLAGSFSQLACIESRNSWFVFVRFIRSMRKLMASAAGMSERKLRSR